MIEPLERPDSFHLEAAEGWLELGNPREAGAELDQITPSVRSHPSVLGVRWQIEAAVKNWEASLTIASEVTRLHPDEPAGWVHQCYSLHELKRTAEARDILLSVADKFPTSPTICYNLACYECQLARLDQAREWLKKALALGDPKQMKLAALQDPDLQPLRDDITRL
jgi:Flp pilus assembly protein TadD